MDLLGYPPETMTDDLTTFQPPPLPVGPISTYNLEASSEAFERAYIDRVQLLCESAREAAKYLDDDADFVNTSIRVIQYFLIPEKLFDEATKLTNRNRATKLVQADEYARKGLDGMLLRIAKGKQAAAEEEAKGGMMDADPTAPKTGGDSDK